MNFNQLPDKNKRTPPKAGVAQSQPPGMSGAASLVYHSVGSRKKEPSEAGNGVDSSKMGETGYFHAGQLAPEYTAMQPGTLSKKAVPAVNLLPLEKMVVATGSSTASTEPSKSYMLTRQHRAKFTDHAVILTKALLDREGKPVRRGQPEKTMLETQIEAACRESNLLRDEEYNGRMSAATRRHVRGITRDFLLAIKTKYPLLQYRRVEYSPDWIYPTFVTLTMPFPHMYPDQTIQEEVFKPFMRWLCGQTVRAKSGKVYEYEGVGVDAYVYVKEAQQNGNVHYHLIIDKAVPALALRKKWNDCLQNLKIIDWYANRQRRIYRKFGSANVYEYQYQESMGSQRIAQTLRGWKKEGRAINHQVRQEARKREDERQRKAFKNALADGFRNPNSTDIHKIRDLKSLTAYVSKYISKGAVMGYKIKATGEVVEKLAEGQVIKTYFEVDHDGQVERFATKKEATRCWYMLDLPTTSLVKRTYIVETVSQLVSGFKVFALREQEVVPWFPVRALKGRIWGYSRSLRDAKKEGVLSAFAAVVGEEEYTHREKFKPVRKAGQVIRYVSEGFEASWEISDQNNDVMDYLSKLREVVPKADILAASARVGPHVDVEIIPLREPQAELMRVHSPKLLDAYRAHYMGIFGRIWGAPPARAA